MSGKVVDNLGRSSGTIKAGSSGANVTYDTTEKTSNFNAEAGVGYLVDTSGGAITATLPASPAGGDSIAFKDYKPSFGTNALTIARNGNKIQGNASNSEISTDRASVVMVYVDSTEGWVFVEESNVGDLNASAYVTASGGTITTSGDFKIHTFTSSGTFTVSNAGNACGSNTVDHLVVAGGGGGAGDWSGGGGAGGYRESFPNPATGGTPVSAQGYPITVGGGGAAGNSSTRGTSGGNSVFSSVTSAGGGGGGADNFKNPSGPCTSSDPDYYDDDGVAGGSGGGGAIDGSGGAGNTPPVSPAQGFAGADGCRANSLQGGGGGGASETGQTQAGGDGRASSINGSPVTRGGGGGGARNGSTGAGGAGGGGTGGNAGNCSSAGSANTGGGGGAMNGSNNGNAGGSGVVIIRYKYQN
jgi:hypothetical protein